MRILLLIHSFNSLAQRLYVELARDGHELSVELDINDEITRQAVTLFRPDLILAPFLKRAIPSAVWQRLPCLILHPGPIGDRGPAALDWAILRGEPRWGVTVLQATGVLDAGPVWAAADFPMRLVRKSNLYRAEVTEAAVLATREALARIAAGERPMCATPPQRVLRPAPTARERAIDWERDSTETVLRKIHSADGHPGVADVLCGRRVRLYDAAAEPDLRLPGVRHGPPGALLARRAQAICRATVDGAVWIGTVQLMDEPARAFKLPATQALAALTEALPESGTEREIAYRECGAIGYLSFDFYNGALSASQCRRLQAAYRSARERPTRVLVLMGGSDFWCNGMHLHCIEAADSPADASWENIDAIDDLSRDILCTDDKLTVSVLRGNAAAGGVFLALAADRVLARSGVVLNPHYRNMGNLYGSEFWTYLLPRRLGDEAARALMNSRLPLGTEEAQAIGLIDAHAGPQHSALEAMVAREVAALADPVRFGTRLAAKCTRRARDEAERPLQSYRDAELECMRLNFFGFDPSYHIARHRFVHRTPHAWTPLYLAAHRRLERPRTAAPGPAAERVQRAPRPGSLMPARRWRIGGRVQGVGFRPFVYRLATASGIGGWVRNRGGVVEVLAQAGPQQLQRFGMALLEQAPPASRPMLLAEQEMPAEPYEVFRILESCAEEQPAVHVPPDLFACEQCLSELHNPLSRRHRYPFINCTQCGPRYTLINALPYDRPNTTMAHFALCPECRAEYLNPLDRRFHAQPLACPRCGPQVYWEQVQREEGGGGGSSPDAVPRGETAIQACLAMLARGGIVAVRGIGGYHLLCDARGETAIAALRARKHRPAKPFALMLPRRGPDGLAAVRALALLSPQEEAALREPSRPIVLLRRRAAGLLPEGLAPGLAELGVMLPYSPLHELLLEGFGGPLVATSGNVSGEPVLTEIEEARTRLAAVADGFLHHDRPIARPADDPVCRYIAGRVRAVRLGRGSAPLELNLPRPIAQPTLAVGAYLKNTVALAWEDRCVISPHIGELDSPRALEVFERVGRDLQALYGVRAVRLVHDAHPGFPSSRWAQRQGLPVYAVWHHHAHASALAGEACGPTREHPADVPLLCFAWDGVGLGSDGTLWGGEAMLGTPGSWRRVATLRAFGLPGGERAARAPWRSALGLCWSRGLAWPAGEARVDPLLRRAFDRGLNAPRTSAAGRVFDAAAALLGICREASYEGEAPMHLEALAAGTVATPLELPMERTTTDLWQTDCGPLVPMLLDTARSPAERAACFHESLAVALWRQAQAVRAATGVRRVGLCGGVFQNRLLSEAASTHLAVDGFEVLLPERVPANDAAISFGQIVEAAAAWR